MSEKSKKNLISDTFNLFNVSKSSKNYNEAIMSSKTLTIVAICQSLAICLLTVAVMKKEVVSTTVPPTFTEEISIQGNRVSPSYQTAWAQFVANLLGNINSRRLNYVLVTLEKMIPVSDLLRVEKQIKEQVARLEIKKIEERFIPLDTIYDPKNSMVWIYGNKETISLRTGDSNTMKWTFEIKIGAHLGLPKILHLQQYEGMPNTQRRQRELYVETQNENLKKQQATQATTE
ncbi:hypothetical protein EIJ81_00545 (plasmid) [Aliivibrio salmonicida]|uniref:TraE/TraK family type IV conjugative transfer system protein n=1 Tax=Aliivibrio salmonicida TaxID=40269 RepID=UPI000F6D182C|nr:TraE/TraK family type IV conjugative transfer system protein [Aliivibrio salmonicida]AZL83388.1 hypothetical protein EIJ81_00545 [Aliivibrio salmonicida]